MGSASWISAVAAFFSAVAAITTTWIAINTKPRARFHFSWRYHVSAIGAETSALDTYPGLKQALRMAQRDTSNVLVFTLTNTGNGSVYQIRLDANNCLADFAVPTSEDPSNGTDLLNAYNRINASAVNRIPIISWDLLQDMAIIEPGEVKIIVLSGAHDVEHTVIRLDWADASIRPIRTKKLKYHADRASDEVVRAHMQFKSKE